MPLIVTRTKRADIRTDKALDAVAAVAVGVLQRRTARGIDMRGNPFRPYSASYAAALVRGGERTNVDLTVTGAFLADIGERSRVVSAQRSTMTIGPGTGTSEGRRARAGKKLKRKSKTGATRKRGRMSVSGGRSPPHNILGAYLHHGTATMPARPWAGFTRDETRYLAGVIARALVVRR